MTAPTTTDLVTWLREQIDEDKHAARWVVDNNHANTSASWTEPSSGIVDTGDDLIATCDSALSRHIIRHDPAAVLAQCEAHTALLYHADLRARAVRTATLDGGVWDYVLRLLALAYQHRPGYREEWRP